MVPVLFSYGLPTEKLVNKYGSRIKDIDLYSRGAWYKFRPGYRLLRISAGVPTVPNFGRGTDFRISIGVLTVPNFGRDTDCSQFRPGYWLFPISVGVLTVPNFGRGTDCSEFLP
jgi:hypothetical protein